MNVISCFVLWQKMLPSGDSYNSLIMCLAFSDTLCCISLLIVAITDYIFHNNCLEHEYFWRANPFCYISSLLSIMGSFLSVFTINLISMARYLIVKDPFQSKFKENPFVTTVCIFASLMSAFLAMSSVLTYITTAENQQLPTGVCLLVGHVEMSSS